MSTELKAAFQPHGLLLTVAVSCGKFTIDTAYNVPAMNQWAPHSLLAVIHQYHLRGSWFGRENRSPNLWTAIRSQTGAGSIVQVWSRIVGYFFESHWVLPSCTLTKKMMTVTRLSGLEIIWWLISASMQDLRSDPLDVLRPARSLGAVHRAQFTALWQPGHWHGRQLLPQCGANTVLHCYSRRTVVRSTLKNISFKILSKFWFKNWIALFRLSNVPKVST